MAKPMEILKARTLLEKAEVVDALWVIEQEWCFSVMKPVSSYVYTSNDAILKQRYSIICDNIITSAREAVLRAMAAKSEEAFISELLTLPTFVYEKAGMLCTTLDIEPPVYGDELLDDLRLVYGKFVAKQRKPRKRRNNKVL